MEIEFQENALAGIIQNPGGGGTSEELNHLSCLNPIIMSQQ